MKHFGIVLFGFLTALSALAVLWLSQSAEMNDGRTVVFGLAVSPILHLVFVGPFAILFVISLIRGGRN